MDTRVYWIWAQHVFGAGSYKPWTIYKRFSGGIKEFQEGGPVLWNTLNYITDKDSQLLYAFTLKEAEAMLELSERSGHQVITPECEIYPEALRNIYDPPAVLYIKGKLPDVDNTPAIAVVGARKCTQEGEKAALSIGYQLALGGAVVVSGGALGIDAAAHKGALRAMGKSICVLACGISDRYLIENFKLRERIAVDGALVTEYPLNTSVTHGTFQVRNRIMSGLCCGTLVIEAENRSGSLITAKHAKNQSRDVFAYPGQSGDPHFTGCQRLIEDGAKPVTAGEMILEEYALRFQPVLQALEPILPGPRQQPMLADPGPVKGAAKKTERDMELSQEARAVLEALQKGDKHISVIEHETGLPSKNILTAVTELELLGLIESLPGRKFTVAE